MLSQRTQGHLILATVFIAWLLFSPAALFFFLIFVAAPVGFVMYLLYRIFGWGL
ncbi:hypothetical protein [Vibrio sp. 1CM23M]|uniref:hypothetical protein n=1 Tax=Vibrio sp. 1CM23M TaxID=2929164 RepID=UPI0020C06073|nr:hypothetical protein [Vibrio sp. 1CM23M]MCK8072452.1 hypothetical protein [Vibrio sp. 1CM23M]